MFFLLGKIIKERNVGIECIELFVGRGFESFEFFFFGLLVM